MKNLIIILFLFAFNMQAQFSEDLSFKADKQKHTIAGTVISGTTFALVYKKTGDEDLAMRAGWMTACAAGMFKELGDFAMGKEMMIGDILYTTAAGVATGYIFKGIVKHRKRKKVKKGKSLEFSETWSLDNEFINN